MDAADTDAVVLPPSAVSYEERPLLPPFFAPAHRSISPLCFCGAQHSFGFSAFADLSLSMMEVFSPFSGDLASAVLSSFGPLLMIPSIMPWLGHLQANRRDLCGQRFGKLTVIRRVEGTQSNRARADSWLCRCDCGNESVVLGSNLVRGHTKSCGCIKLNDLTGQHIGSVVSIPLFPRRRYGINSSSRSVKPHSGISRSHSADG